MKNNSRIINQHYVKDVLITIEVEHTVNMYRKRLFIRADYLDRHVQVSILVTIINMLSLDDEIDKIVNYIKNENNFI